MLTLIYIQTLARSIRCTRSYICIVTYIQKVQNPEILHCSKLYIFEDLEFQLRVQNLYQCTDLGRVQGVKAGPTIIMHIQS